MLWDSILFKNEGDELAKEIRDGYLETFGETYEETEAKWKKEKEDYWKASLEKYHLRVTEVPAFRDKYKKRLEKYMKRIGCRCCQRVAVSHALCDYLESHEPDEEDYFFWKVCIMDHEHTFFDEHTDFNFKSQDVYSWFFMLLDRMEIVENIYIHQKKSDCKYARLMSEIVFNDESVGEIDLDKVKLAVMSYNIDGECFDDNLKRLSERICLSPELFKVAPLVFYAALMRYTKKMTDTQDYTMNFPKALRRIEYSIDKDNGKNVQKFLEHLKLFYSLCDALCNCEEDRYLCYAGFRAITNIGECQLIYWGELDELRPLEAQIDFRGFDGFAHNSLDNPCYSENTVALIDLMQYEDYDKTLPNNKKFLGKIRNYIINDPQAYKDYIKLIQEDRTEECIPIVNRILTGSEIDMSDCSVRMNALLQAIVVEELMNCISTVTKYRLLSFMGFFDDIISRQN